MSLSDVKTNANMRPVDGVDNPSARTAELFHFLGSDWQKNIDIIVSRTLAVIGGLFSVYIEIDRGKTVVRSSSTLPLGLAGDLASRDTCFNKTPLDDEIFLLETDAGNNHLNDPVAEKYGLNTLLGTVVRSNGKTIGILWVADTRSVQFSSDQLHAIHCFAGALASQETLKQSLKKDREKQKVGEMAGQVAHDLNNILTGLVSYPELVLMQLDRESPLHAPVSFMHESGVLASDLVQDFLLLARPQSYKPPRLDPLQVIRSYFSGSTHVRLKYAHPHIYFSLDADSDLPHIRISEILFTKLITTLMTHSADRMRGSSKIDVCLSNYNPAGSLTENAMPGHHMVMSVRDNGKMLNDEDINHLFDPFYVKKQMGYAGSGLGLSVIKKVMTDHGGYVTAQNMKTTGTEVCLFFPAANNPTANNPDD